MEHVHSKALETAANVATRGKSQHRRQTDQCHATAVQEHQQSMELANRKRSWFKCHLRHSVRCAHRHCRHGKTHFQSFTNQVSGTEIACWLPIYTSQHACQHSSQRSFSIAALAYASHNLCDTCQYSYHLARKTYQPASTRTGRL